jgi:hypothetical protein
VERIVLNGIFEEKVCLTTFALLGVEHVAITFEIAHHFLFADVEILGPGTSVTFAITLVRGSVGFGFVGIISHPALTVSCWVLNAEYGEALGFGCRLTLVLHVLSTSLVPAG